MMPLTRPAFRLSPALLLSIFGALLLAFRLHTYYEPLERDSGTYAAVARLLLEGKQLYTDIPEQKPPAIHATYVLAQLIAGYGRGSIFLLNILASISTLLAVYVAGSAFGQKAGLWAAAFWTLTSGHLALEANQPNSEVFINTFHAWGIALLLRHSLAEQRHWRRLIVIGLCFGAATLYKHIVVLIPAALCAGLVLFPPRGKTRTGTLLDGAVIGAVIIAAWLVLVAWFAHTGQLAAMHQYLVNYNRAYAGSLSENLLEALHWKKLFPKPLWGTIPLWLLVAAGFGFAIRERKAWPALPFLALAAGTAAAVALPGKFWAHYYQLWFPFLIIGAAWAVSGIQAAPRVPAVVGKWAAPAVLLALAIIELPSYAMPATHWSFKKYGRVFIRSEQVAAELNDRLKPHETFIVLGSEPQLYVLTNRVPPVIMGADGLLAGPMVPELTNLWIREMNRTMPDMLILGFAAFFEMNLHPDLPIARWLNEWVPVHYAPSPTGHDHMPHFLFVRKGSELQKRWQADADAAKAASPAPVP